MSKDITNMNHDGQIYVKKRLKILTIKIIPSFYSVRSTVVFPNSTEKLDN